MSWIENQFIWSRNQALVIEIYICLTNWSCRLVWICLPHFKVNKTSQMRMAQSCKIWQFLSFFRPVLCFNFQFYEPRQNKMRQEWSKYVQPLVPGINVIFKHNLASICLNDSLFPLLEWLAGGEKVRLEQLPPGLGDIGLEGFQIVVGPPDRPLMDIYLLDKLSEWLIGGVPELGPELHLELCVDLGDSTDKHACGSLHNKNIWEKVLAIVLQAMLPAK